MSEDEKFRNPVDREEHEKEEDREDQEQEYDPSVDLLNPLNPMFWALFG